MWGCTALGSEQSSRLCGAVRLHRLHGAEGHWAWGDPVGFMGLQGPGLGVALQTAWGHRAWDGPKGWRGASEPLTRGSPSVRPAGAGSCHGMQGTLLAPFAWFATQKYQLGAPPSGGRVTLFFLFS